MHYIRALSLVASIGLAAVTAHARLQPRGEAGITGLPDASFAEGLYERDVDDGYERFYGSLHARDASALYEQGPEALPKRTPASVPSVDEIAALLPRAGNSRSGSGTKASKSRSVTPRPGWPLVSMGQAKFIMLGEGQGIETSGVLGCIAVGVVGSKGIAVAHLAPKSYGKSTPPMKKGSPEKKLDLKEMHGLDALKGLLLKVGSPAKATIYAPSTAGPSELSNIKRALGHIVPTVQPYTFVDGAMTTYELRVTSHGAMSWKKYE